VILQPTIVFDLDGTLADTIQDLVAALNRILETYDVPPHAASELAHLTGKGGLRAMISHAFASNGKALSQEDIEEVFADTVKDYDRNIVIETVLYPGVQASLEQFRAAGWLLAVCTNKPIAQAEKLLRALEIETFFQAITGADSFAFKKPDPRHLIQTIEIAGGRPQTAIMVGDTITDVLTAQNAGIRVIAVDFGYSDIDVGALAPDGVISGFDALFAAASALIA
jgi:phosphoglycolate phosphatase